MGTSIPRHLEYQERYDPWDDARQTTQEALSQRIDMFPTLSYDPEVDDKPQPSFDQWQFWVNANVNDEPDIYFM